MIWPVGQPTAELEDLAMRSREHWQAAAEEMGFWIAPRGSLTLAYHDLEMQVLAECCELSDPQHGRRIIDAAQVAAIEPRVRQENLRGALFSPTEWGVDPREIVHQFADKAPFAVRFSAPVSKIEPGSVELAGGEIVSARIVVVCAGPDLRELYPEITGKLTRCRLQMMRLQPRNPELPMIGTHLCAGLTLAHYGNFAQCPSLSDAKRHLETKWPVQVGHHIHVLVAQHPDGTVTVGDSHEYGEAPSPYLAENVEAAILEAMDEFLPVSDYEVAERWEGIYNTSSEMPFWKAEIGDGIYGLNLFGTGMTLSFGVTELLSKELMQKL